MSEEVLDIKFRTSTQDDKYIITYTIDGNYEDEGIFIDKDGKLGNTITGHLNESLKNKTTMLGIYKNYLEQKSPILSNISKQATLFGKNFGRTFNGGSKKTKSKRSPNANKTLKNRK
jgi:hypothetical protein